MPGKARRVASRQAQLNRRKRQQRGPSGIPAVEATEDQQSAEETASQANGVVNSSEATADAPAATAAARAPRPAGPGRLRREHVASANYIGAELRRILIMGSVILVVLIVLGITV